MKHFILTVLLVLSASMFAQETVSIVFSANTDNSLYCPFTSVNVTNKTKGWTLNLFYPDTVLTLGNMVNVGEISYSNRIISLCDAYPNPFTEATYLLLDVSEESEVLLQALKTDGSTLATKQFRLISGTYRVKLTMSDSQLALLVATVGSHCQTVKVVHTGRGSNNSIEVELVSNLRLRDLELMGDFEPGDLMSYEAQLIDEGNVINSASITQPQFHDETVTLLFDLDLPTVSTIDVGEITWNSALVVGEVSDNGNTTVKERGVCWSTSHEPTISDAHTVEGAGPGVFRAQLTDLTANTSYFARAYAVNCIGTNYGAEMEITTTDLPNYTVGVFAIPDNGGIAMGGGDYQLGQECTMRAIPNPGYSFMNWMVDGNQVSEDTCYTFMVSDNHTVVAHFCPAYNFYEGQGQDYSHFTKFSFTNEVYCAFDSLAVGFPSYITKQFLGKACDNQDLYCYEFGKEEGIDKPKIVIICTQHGFEKNSTYGMYYFLKDVIGDNGTNPFLSYVYDNLHLIIVPVTNPSGFNARTYRNANGVNLNRNWPVANWTCISDPTSSNYSGLAPLDQPETRVVDSLVNMNLDAKLFIDFHTNGGGVLDTARKINWLSIPMIEDTLKRRVLLELSQEHLDSVSANFKRMYGLERPSLMNTPRLGYITVGQQFSTIGYAPTSMSQRGLLALTFEGFCGFPGDSTPFMPDAVKANSELIGNFLFHFCNHYLHWYSANEYGPGK